MRRDVFTTIRSEGALLPPDFLKRIAEGDKDVPGLEPQTYHLQEREKLSEAITRSWNRLLGFWAAFQSASAGLKEGDAATGFTREKWLLPLFQELGYGRLPAGKGFEIDGKSYPISHVWQNTPIHVLGRNVDLDRPTKGVAGAAKASPHGLVQEFLNRHEGHLWGFLSNGLKLRILRDNKSLTRQAYVEFDLAAMMEGQVYSDFAVVWLLCHQSRGEAEQAEQCWLEKWADTARQQGTRALDQLRDGVQQAIEALGRGFLAHPASKDLVAKLRDRTLDKQDYYRQLLRIVYRLIFLFVAEDRDLLLTAAKASRERDRYQRYYSVSRLRTLAERRRGSPHPDLWQGLRFVFAHLSSDTGCADLGLPPLGSFLWSDKATPDLDRSELANTYLLEAVRSLAFTLEGKVHRAIDYRNLGAEELGSVYESLLELHPDVNTDAPTFDLSVAAGHERKTTGSYYTPTSLIECLLDSALEPVVQEALKQPDPEKAILVLKVCDPACGSGHFLIAAAHRIAKYLAAVRTEDEEPSPEAVRKALRDIVGRCLYGVDINPMAVELCKVNLWLEALEPGKPLSFLEHHIQCGNSLLGTTPALIKKGIPDEAFEPLEGDDKAICRIFKKKNKAEREGGQGSLLERMHDSPGRLRDLAGAIARLEAIPDETPGGQQAKQQRWEQLVDSDGYVSARLWADAWCAAFVWKKVDDPSLLYPITEATFRQIEKDPVSLPDWMRHEIRRLAGGYQFLHWHLAFPGVFHLAEVAASDSENRPGWGGGFDLVLGNPPWDRIKLQEKEFFAAHRPAIAGAANAAARGRMIRQLAEEDPSLLRAFHEALRRADGESALVRRTGRYPLCGRGDVNTYAVFAELNRTLLGPKGRAGVIVPSGIATDDTTKFFFQDLAETGSLASLYSFFETRRVFPGTDSRAPFCLLTIRRPHVGEMVLEAEFAFDLRSVADLVPADRRFELSAEDIALLNPNTRTCPVFRTRRDAEITKKVYRRVSVLVNESKGVAGNPWNVEFQAMFHMSNDSGLFRTANQLESEGWTMAGNIFERGTERSVPLYEAKMVHQFNHRFGDYADRPADSESTALPHASAGRLADPTYLPLPRYWIPEANVNDRLHNRWDRCWLLGWRDISRSTDERTVIASVVPRVGVGDKFLLMFPAIPAKGALMCANLNSFAFDYQARQKLGGTSLKYFVMKQLPVLPPQAYDQPALWAAGMNVGDWIGPRALELIYTAWDIQSFARDLGYDSPPFRWDPDRRFQVRCELDAAFFLLYGIEQDDVAYIMDTFTIVREADEATYGNHRTKQTVMTLLEKMAANSVSSSSAVAETGLRHR